MIKPQVVIAVGALAAVANGKDIGCSTPPVAAELERAEQILRTEAADGAHRAEALALFDSVSDRSADTSLEVRAAFGRGAIAFLDLVDLAIRLQDSGFPTTTPTGDGQNGPTAAPETLAVAIDRLLHTTIDDKITEAWDVVIDHGTFTFTFDDDAAAFPWRSLEPRIDLSREWDTADLLVLTGALQSALALFEYLQAYDGLLPVLIEAGNVLASATVPEVPSTPTRQLLRAVDALRTAGFDPLPWEREDFALLNPDADLAAIRARLDGGLRRIERGLAEIQQESDPQEDDLLPADGFFSGLASAFAAGPDQVPQRLLALIIDNRLDLDDLQRIVRDLRASLAGSEPYVPHDAVWEMLRDALSILPGYEGPRDPLGFRIPGLDLSRLFTFPVVDLTDPEEGFFPWFCTTDAASEQGCARPGDILIDSEQEPYETDSEGNRTAFEDAGVNGTPQCNTVAQLCQGLDLQAPGAGNGRWDEPIALRATDPEATADNAALLPPLAHPTPWQTTDPPNDIVDPLYMYFGNPDLNGAFVPLTETSANGVTSIVVDHDRSYTNPDLMRLLSVAAWIADSLPGLLK